MRDRSSQLLGIGVVAFVLGAAGCDGSGGGSMAMSGGLCSSCTTHDECGGAQDYCVRNRRTGTSFCGRDCSGSSCPTGYSCAPISSSGGTTVEQCVPSSGSCGGGSGGTDGGTSSGGADGGTSSGGMGGTNSDLMHCVDVINSYRAMVGKPPLARSSSLEDYAAVGAMQDGISGNPHGHFIATSGGGVASAENEVPRWPLANFGDVATVIERGTAAMWSEGPGGGHYENIVGSYTAVGCGVYVSSDGLVTVTQDFH